jgi:hypothetical protein
MDDAPTPTQHASIADRVAEELAILTPDETQVPGFDEISLGGATYTKMLSRRV